MAEGFTDQYSASEQGLGYIYQPRFALLQILQLSENTSVLIEKTMTLTSLTRMASKHLPRSSTRELVIG